MGDDGMKTMIVGTPENLTEARQMLAELTQKYLAGELSDSRYRAAVYGCNALVKALAHEKVVQIEARLAALEKARGAK